MIREYAVEMINAAGFEAIEAASADEAIEILECRSDIRIVFTDIHMPGSIDGLKLGSCSPIFTCQVPLNGVREFQAVNGTWHVNIGEHDPNITCQVPLTA